MQSNIYVYILNLYELELRIVLINRELQIVLINNTVKLVTYTQIMLSCHTLYITMLNAMLFLNIYDDVK